MKSVGWIPILGPGLNVSVPDPMSQLGDSVHIISDDSMNVGPVHLQLNLPNHYEYGKTVLPINVTCNRGSIKVEVIIHPDGIVTLESTESTLLDDSIEQTIISMIYREIKRRFHEDTHHNPNTLNEDTFYEPNEQILLTSGEITNNETREELFFLLLYVIHYQNNRLSRLVSLPRPDDRRRLDGLELTIQNVYKLASGFIAYSMNFVSLFFRSYQLYVNSLNAYQASLDILYQTHCNEDSHKLNSSFLETVSLMRKQNTDSAQIAKDMNYYTIAILGLTVINVFAVCYQILVR